MAAHIDPPVPPQPEQNPPAPARKRNSRAAKVVLTALVVAGAMLAAYQYEADIRAARKPAAPVRKAPADAAETAAGPPAIKPAHVVGPWRCTDQGTGASTFWTYGEDGTLSYHGDDHDRRDRPIVRPGLPAGWTLDGNRLTLRFESAPAQPFTLDRLSLAELDYRNAAGDEVRCRRP